MCVGEGAASDVARCQCAAGIETVPPCMQSGSQGSARDEYSGWHQRAGRRLVEPHWQLLRTNPQQAGAEQDKRDVVRLLVVAAAVQRLPGAQPEGQHKRRHARRRLHDQAACKSTGDGGGGAYAVVRAHGKWRQQQAPATSFLVVLAHRQSRARPTAAATRCRRRSSGPGGSTRGSTTGQRRGRTPTA